MRKTVRETKKVIQQSMDSTSTSTVMSNRMSWRKFDRIRISETLEDCAHQTPTRVRKRQSEENTPPSRPKRKHGSNTDLSETAKEELLAEARSWDEDGKINWSDVARRYGMTKSNAG